ncbi:hypothetical protein [Actinoplanes sp. NPDC051859]|uniref:hypothetical protein n=1 Tax=Actinoplanes sp. NPDC051859 TaxID=3363909 RepID=UPI0037B53A32
MSRAVRLGLGRGAMEQLGPAAVFGFLQVDPRWDWQVDERAVFLVRLIRDGSLPRGPVVDVLDAPGLDDDHDPELPCEILGLLGEREALARQVREGPYWEEALAAAQAGGYAGELRETAPRRMLTEDRSFPWRGEPWQSWATDDPRVAARMVEPPLETTRPYADLPVEQLIGRLLTAMETAPWRSELRRRPADPIVLRYADHPLTTRLITWIGRLDVEMVLPEARRWAVTVGHRLRKHALDLLAEHGDARDVPAIAGGTAHAR